MKKLEIIVRSIVKINGKDKAEWTETVYNWKKAWSVVDNCCERSEVNTNKWCLENAYNGETNTQLSGTWYLDIRRDNN